MLSFSRANMLLFLTRDAFWSFSNDVRRVGEGEPRSGAFSVLANWPGAGDSRPFQNVLGEFSVLGDASNGDESPLKASAYSYC